MAGEKDAQNKPRREKHAQNLQALSSHTHTSKLYIYTFVFPFPGALLTPLALSARPQVIRHRLLKYLAAFCVLDCVGAATLPFSPAPKFGAATIDGSGSVSDVATLPGVVSFPTLASLPTAVSPPAAVVSLSAVVSLPGRVSLLGEGSPPSTCGCSDELEAMAAKLETLEEDHAAELEGMKRDHAAKFTAIYKFVGMTPPSSPPTPPPPSPSPPPKPLKPTCATPIDFVLVLDEKPSIFR